MPSDLIWKLFLPTEKVAKKFKKGDIIMFGSNKTPIFIPDEDKRVDKIIKQIEILTQMIETLEKQVSIHENKINTLIKGMELTAEMGNAVDSLNQKTETLFGFIEDTADIIQDISNQVQELNDKTQYL